MDSLDANDLKTDMYTPHVVLCGRCQREVNAPLAHDANPAALKDRDLWSDLAKIDEELAALKKRRLETLYALNRQSLINRLPFDLISRILCLSLTQLDDVFDTYAHGTQFKWSPLILLGAVCKEWREITVTTPHLWSTITIYPYSKFASWADIIEKWIQRSGNLPLSIILANSFDEAPSDFPMKSSLEATLKALRSCSFRWKSINVRRTCRSMFSHLLQDLQDTPPIETLFLDCEDNWAAPPISIPTPFRPKTFHGVNMYFYGGFSGSTFLEWDNITYLDIEGVYASEVILIIQHAVNIEHCAVRGSAHSNLYGLYPSVPIVRRSLKHLTIEGYYPNRFLQSITLPSLETVECRCISQIRPDPAFVRNFLDLLDRSQASPREIILDVEANFKKILQTDKLWNPELPDITHIKVSVLQHSNGTSTYAILKSLAYDKDQIEHPSLHTLELTTSFMNSESWSLFLNIFPQIPDNIHDDNLSTDPSGTTLPLASTSRLRRPLSRVYVTIIQTDLSPVSEQETDPCPQSEELELHHCLRLLDIEKSGVELELIGPDGVDLLQSARKKYKAQL